MPYDAVVSAEQGRTGIVGDGSWVLIDVDRGRITQGGPRRLWDALEIPGCASGRCGPARWPPWRQSYYSNRYGTSEAVRVVDWPGLAAERSSGTRVGAWRSGSAPALGAGGPQFESGRPDLNFPGRGAAGVATAVATQKRQRRHQAGDRGAEQIDERSCRIVTPLAKGAEQRRDPAPSVRRGCMGPTGSRRRPRRGRRALRGPIGLRHHPARRLSCPPTPPRPLGRISMPGPRTPVDALVPRIRGPAAGALLGGR